MVNILESITAWFSVREFGSRPRSCGIEEALLRGLNLGLWVRSLLGLIHLDDLGRRYFDLSWQRAG
jgi:hypothetical protein